MAPGGKVPKDKSWKAAKVMMAKVNTHAVLINKNCSQNGNTFAKMHIWLPATVPFPCDIRNENMRVM